MMKIGAVILYVDDFDTALVLNRDTVGLDVADLATERARLDAMGATETRDWGTCFVLSDPEGNRLQVYEFAG